MSWDISNRVCGGRDWRSDILERLRACQDMNHELMTPSIFTHENSWETQWRCLYIWGMHTHGLTLCLAVELRDQFLDCVSVLSARTRSNHWPVIFTNTLCLASDPATVGHLQRCITLWGIFEPWLWQKAWLLTGVMMRCSGLGRRPVRTVGSSRHHLWLRQHILRSAPPLWRGRRLTRPKVNVSRWAPRNLKQPISYLSVPSTSCAQLKFSVPTRTQRIT